MKKYRILSLDGGGVWALNEVKALMKVYGESASGHKVLKDFDLVAGNSGGSIVLGALLTDMPLKRILNLFTDEAIRRRIFSPACVLDVLANGFAEEIASFVSEDSVFNCTGIMPRYSTEHKLSALRSVLSSPDHVSIGDVALSEVTADVPCHNSGKLHVLITAFDYDLNRAVFFRSSGIRNPQWGESEASKHVTLVEAIHASSTAPVSYFDRPAEFTNRPERFWDGAIAGCNNPVLAAVTEAIGIGQDPNNLAVLTIGTGIVVLPRSKHGQQDSPFFQPLFEPGCVTDLRKIATAIIDDPPDIATFLAHVMTASGKGLSPTDRSRVVRMNPMISPVIMGDEPVGAPGSMTPSDFEFLKKLELDAIRPAEVRAIEAYAELWLSDVAPNQPIRMKKTLEPELGHACFSQARASWDRIKGGRTTIAKRKVA